MQHLSVSRDHGDVTWVQGCQIWATIWPDWHQVGQILDYLSSVFFCSFWLTKPKWTENWSYTVTDLSHLVAILLNWRPNMTFLAADLHWDNIGCEIRKRHGCCCSVFDQVLWSVNKINKTSKSIDHWLILVDTHEFYVIKLIHTGATQMVWLCALCSHYVKCVQCVTFK